MLCFHRHSRFVPPFSQLLAAGSATVRLVNGWLGWFIGLIVLIVRSIDIPTSFVPDLKREAQRPATADSLA
jgi:hypothetical protein